MASEPYFPEPEDGAGWRRLVDLDELRDVARIDAAALSKVEGVLVDLHEGPWAVVVIRRGHIVAEWLGVPALPSTTFDVWSCTKSFTSLAIGMLIEDGRPGDSASGNKLELDRRVDDFLPNVRVPDHPGKTEIEVGHLLSMTSGIPGEDRGFMGMAAGLGCGPFEIALGLARDRRGRSGADLVAAAGEIWDYSDLGFAQLSLVFREAAGMEIADFLAGRLFEPLGITNYGWDSQGGGGFLGPHTTAHTGLRLAARDMARVGYLLMRNGLWGTRRIVPEWWIDLATKPSQDLNPEYGYGFWSNASGTMWPALPRDGFAMRGFASNRCAILPSLDLVVARVGYGPPDLADESLLGPIAEAMLD